MHYRERGAYRPGTARRRSSGTVGLVPAPLPRASAIAIPLPENRAHCSSDSNKAPLY